MSEMLSPMEKAQQINFDPMKYGSFAEIGAGQEVARWFFRAGKASSTVAKTMSAYDMVFSDAIYGAEKDHRYVCESRLEKMLEKEYSLLQKRLWDVRGDRSQFFVFADTVASNSKQGGHGWLGVRFQTEALGEHSSVVVHVRLLDHSTLDQQEAVGIVGVNLIYGGFYLHKDPVALTASLVDNLKSGRIEIDMIRFSGPAFKNTDNRLMSLHLVDLKLSDATLIAPHGEILQPSDAFYKKNILVQRGRFRPLTKLHVDMLHASKKQFLRDPQVKEKDLIVLMEISLNNLTQEGSVDISDFLSRVEILTNLGYYVLISNYAEHHKLSAFLSRFATGKIGFVMGIGHLHKIFDPSYYKNLLGGMLEALGVLFRPNVCTFIYPAHSLSLTRPSPDVKNKQKLMTANSYEPVSSLKHLYLHMLENHAIEDLKDYDESLLNINSEDVLKDMQNGGDSWKKSVPQKTVAMIESKHLYGYGARTASKRKVR